MRIPGVTGAMLPNHPHPLPGAQLPVRHSEYIGEM